MDKTTEADKTDKPAFKIAASKMGDIKEIVELVNSESGLSGALLKITESDVDIWIHEGFSFVAKNTNGKVIGHLSAHIWPKSQWIELRSSIVTPEYRGQGISRRLNATMLNAVTKRYGKKTVVAFTNPSGSGKGILLAMGFHEAQYDDLPKELFTIGPPYRGKKEYGYKIFLLDPDNPQPTKQ